MLHLDYWIIDGINLVFTMNVNQCDPMNNYIGNLISDQTQVTLDITIFLIPGGNVQMTLEILPMILPMIIPYAWEYSNEISVTALLHIMY